MNIFDREVVKQKDANAKKAANQILEDDVQDYHVVVPGHQIGQKFKNALMGGLTAADLSFFDYWESLGETPEARDKNYKGDAIQMLRWMATVGEPNWNAWRRNGSKGRPPLSDSELTAYHIIMTNEVANLGFWDLTDHPELQFKLLCMVGIGEKQNHHWLDMPGRKKSKGTKVEELFRKRYPGANSTEMDILMSNATKKSIERLAKDFALQDKEIKEILKDFK